jgi:hypothetical protein
MNGEAMSDEFHTRRERLEAYPTMLDYCKSRDDDGLARLIWDDMHRSNIFGTYDGTVGEHSRAILAAAAFNAK